MTARKNYAITLHEAPDGETHAPVAEQLDAARVRLYVGEERLDLFLGGRIMPNGRTALTLRCASGGYLLIQPIGAEEVLLEVLK